MSDSRKVIMIIGLIVTACAIVYAQVTGFDFINIDDRAYVWENPAVQSGLNSRSIAWAFTAFYSGNWHPLTWLSHMLDAQLFGPWAGGHHITNAILHAINSILVFVVFRSMTGALWRPAIVALLFAVHPTHVESVAWVAERKDVLSTFFWLLTMLAYVRYARQPRWSMMAIVVGLFALGLMAKPMLVTLPFVLLLCDYWPLRRLNTAQDLRHLVIEKLPLFALTIASSVITYMAQSAGGATASLTLVPIDARIANAITSYGRYIAKLFIPYQLGIWYPFSTNAISVVAAIVAVSVITILVWRFRRGNEFLVMGWLWFAGTLVPVIGLVQVGMQSHADRYTYIPYIGLFVMIVWGVAEISGRWKLSPRVLATAAVIVLSVLTVVAYRQTSLWKNSGTLYEHTLTFTENNHFLMSNLCLHYLQKSDVATADRRCTELLAPLPPSSDSLQILGYLRLETGKYDEAVRLLQDAAGMNSSSGQIKLHLAQALARRGNVGEAEQAFDQAIKLRGPGVNAESVARTSVVIGDSFLTAGRKDKAIDYYQKALSAMPGDQEANQKLKSVGMK